MLDMKLKNLFFDRKAVIDALGRARATVLGKAGSYVRRTARTLLRYGSKKSKTVSAPGEVPITHTTDEVRSLRNIQFSYDPTTKSVVIGPVKLSSKTVGVTPQGTVPNVLEFGGSVTIREKLTNQGWRIVGAGAIGGAQPVRTRTLNYAKRPVMAPSLQQTLPRLPELWRDSVVKGK